MEIQNIHEVGNEYSFSIRGAHNESEVPIELHDDETDECPTRLLS